MHTLHTIIILNLRLKEFVTIWEFTLLFFHTSKILLASIFAYAHIFSGLKKKNHSNQPFTKFHCFQQTPNIYRNMCSVLENIA